ncbi:alanine racemase [Alteromonas sp. C1M14]|uniref:alanine racemase n=1 Tax=Alteromonas sp. C1M14 TaxID=2841567 RepID=UPI001C09D379|nr:alanine racemase [Alteromonas sp. C1M14]MBU2978718.1 alanine racemase [Alteromonas sp. C1M14]
MSRQTRAVIHADALLHNFDLLSAMVTEGQSMAVIKADAYGHGAINVARILSGRSPSFAVAIVEEAILLRDAGITVPIVVLEGPHQDYECAVAGQQNYILVVHQRQQLQWLASCSPDQRPTVWLKVDSGMHRLGFQCHEIPPLLSEYKDLFRDPPVLVTHLACADDLDNPFNLQQLDDFLALRDQTGLAVSIANSPAVVGWPQSRAQWNRLGIALYGAQPLQNDCGLSLQPVMSLQSSVISVRTVKVGDTVGYSQTWQAKRPSVIATVAIGYADGYPRHCPSGTPVVVNGQKASLAGRVSMDMITVDVTDIPIPKPGDPVELWGQQLPVDEVARCAGTISYELLSRVSSRVPRLVRYV